MVAQMAAAEVVGVIADAIAGKPAPTGFAQDLWELACQR